MKNENDKIQMFEMYDPEIQRQKMRDLKTQMMFHELDEKNRKLEERRVRLNKLRKIKIYVGVTLMITASTIALKKQSDYLNKPIQIVTHDIMANEGYLLTENGKKADPKKFSLEDEDKLYKYLKNKNISAKEVRDSINAYAKSKGFSESLVLSKVKEDYPELFSTDIEIHKTR